MEIKVFWKMPIFFLLGRLLFHTNLRFLYADSASAVLCLEAVLNGLLQLPSENEINGVALRGSTRSSVLVRLRCIPYVCKTASMSACVNDGLQFKLQGWRPKPRKPALARRWWMVSGPRQDAHSCVS